MVLTNLHDITCKLMTHDCRMLCNVRMNTLVSGTENGTLVGGHADTVRNNLNEDLVIGDLRKFKFLQSQIIGCVKSYASCFHNKTPFYLNELLPDLQSCNFFILSILFIFSNFSNYRSFLR